MGSCMSLNYCNRGSSGHSGRRRHRNRRDQVECNGGNGGSVESETAESRQPNNHRSPSFSNITSTNGDNLIEPTSNSYQSTISNSFSTNQRFIPPTGKNKRLKRDYVKYLKQSYEGRVWASSARKMTESQLTAKRDEFWHTAPAFEGKPEIWAALKASVEALETRNYQLAQAIIDSANIILPNGIINDCYDELGNRYQLPMYVLLKPTNLGHNASNEQNSNDFESESSTSKAEKPANKERSKKKKKNKGNQSSDDNDDNFDDYINCDQEDSDDPSCYANSQRKGISSKSKKSKIKASTSNQANGSDPIPSNQQQQQKQKTTEQSLQVKFRISSFNQDSSKSDIKMTVSPSESVLSVKKRLNDLYKIEPSSQRFFFAGKMMKDKEKMKSHKLKKNVVIQVIVREKVAASEDTIKEIN